MEIKSKANIKKEGTKLITLMGNIYKYRVSPKFIFTKGFLCLKNLLIFFIIKRIVLIYEYINTSLKSYSTAFFRYLVSVLNIRLLWFLIYKP